MPVRQLSKQKRAAKTSSSSDVLISTVRVATTGSELSAGAVGSSTMISASGVGIHLLRDCGRESVIGDCGRADGPQRGVGARRPRRGAPIGETWIPALPANERRFKCFKPIATYL